MGYCYKTNLSNELPKYSVVAVLLKEFTSKPLSPSLNLYTEGFKKLFFFPRKRVKEK